MDIPADSTGTRRAGWGATAGTVVALQWAVILGLSLVAWFGFGRLAGLSLLFGGGAVALPNALLALWLTVRLLRAGPVGVVGMLGGELLKLGLTIVLLAVGVSAYRAQIAWIALIVGVVAALKAQWLALWFTRNS
jgi:ATP synthase protein I